MGHLRFHRARLRARLIKGIIAMIAAPGLVLAATLALHAQAPLSGWTQDWMPDILAVPEDAQLLSDRAIGSSVRIFSFDTAGDIDAIFADWQRALETGGFQIDQGMDDLLERSIEFSGTGITNAKIVAGATDDAGRTVITVDATLR